MNEKDLLQARFAVRRASNQLAETARALAVASAKVREIGLAARIADLRQAVVTGRRAGVSLDDLAQDARLPIATIQQWIARGRPTPPHQ
jgi:DNA-directed RNA polymerase specialized sigma24 family protein